MNKYLIYIIIAVLAFGGGVMLAQPVKNLGGTVENFPVWFTSGIKMGTAGTTLFGSDGSITLNGGTALTNYKCATASWNPLEAGGLGTSTSTATTTIALTGAALGDVCFGAFSLATSTDVRIGCNVNVAGTTTISVSNLFGTSIDLATGTAKVCYIH